MASATTDEKDEKAMASDVAAPGADDRDDRDEKHHAPPPPTTRDGFFHIYKSGQGYWTRMGTALGALLIAGLVIYFLYQHLPTWLLPAFDHSAQITDLNARVAAANRAVKLARDTSVGICAGFLLAFGLLTFWLMNKPSNADFLIATDSEMKKVNWTSRKELIGSTKVVIIFMFLIAFLLFSFDILFGYLFYFMGVLKTKPF